MTTSPLLVPMWDYSATTRWCHRIGVASLLLYLSTWVLSLDFSRAFEPILMLVYLVAVFSQPSRAKTFGDPLWILLAIWLILQLITLPPAMALFPDYADGQITTMRGLTKVFLIIPIAWILAGSTRLCLWALVALIVGMVASSLLTGESPTTLAAYIQDGNRPKLGFKNWQHAGTCAGVILIAQACFFRRFLHISRRNSVARVTLIAGFILVCLWALVALGITMTRAAWLGIAVVIIVGVISIMTLLARGHLNDSEVKRRFGLALIAGLLLSTAIGWLYGDQIATRLFAEHHVIMEVLSGDLSNVPFTSIGFRIHAWHYASQLIVEQPWFGWGPKSHIPLMLESTNPIGSTTLGAIAANYDLRHFHSSYVSLLVGYGVAGLALYSAVIIVIGLAAWRSWKRGHMPGDVMCFLGLFFIFWVVVNAFESYMQYRTGVYVIGTTGGIAYTYAMRARLMNTVTAQ